jgi:Zn-finger protein
MTIVTNSPPICGTVSVQEFWPINNEADKNTFIFCIVYPSSRSRVNELVVEVIIEGVVVIG